MYWLFIVFNVGIIFESFVPINALVGGKTSSIEEFPYLVALETKAGFTCAGVILTPNHIVTTAACIASKYVPPIVQVRVGSNFSDRGGTVHRVVSGVIHGNYSSHENNIGLLLLEEPIEFDNKTRGAIKMVDKIELGSVGTVPGWGSMAEGGALQDNFRKIQLKITDKTNGWIQAGNKNQSICAGDSGDPMVIDGKLAGIAAISALGCDSEPQPNDFVDVAFYSQWIDNSVVELSNYFSSQMKSQ